jgi:F0F1-type ATP synthase membrane subunit c/vacuolar-type H+-ATPase subunit K
VKGTADPIRSAHCLAYGLGLALCLGTPGLIAVLLVSGTVPAGIQPPEGIFQQLGYLFTGLVFLSASWVWWRSIHALRTFKDLPEDRRPSMILREGLIYAVVFESSSLYGLVYWVLVGSHAPRHVWGFILMTPLLFLALFPRYTRWAKALEG